RQQASVDMAMRLQTPQKGGMTPEFAAFAKIGINDNEITAYAAKQSAAERLFERQEISREERDKELAGAKTEVQAKSAEAQAKVDAALTSGQLSADVVDLVKGGV